MKVESPKIDGRKFGDIFNRLREMPPHYTPEWKGADEKEPGVALLKIFSCLAEGVINRLNQAPQKNFIAFLDMLGIKLLPAQPAKVPLTFTLAKGTDKGILIPPRTQAAAAKTTEHEEQPFETESNLLAIASQLKKAISIDPGNDAIYQPPPGFLEGTVQGLMATAYQIVSSPVAGARDFQLDHVTDLKEGDYLLISDGSLSEYVIISGISGMIVTIRDRLVNGYATATPVSRVVSFSLFEGKNLQEHSLYLGHKELFNIKSTALFTIRVTHRPGTTTGLTPLKLSWEYWGEVTGEDGEDWRLFQAADGTNGLSMDGDIDLVKTVGGEIKEKESNGVKNRWIRCRVVETLSVDTPVKLPVLDNVTIVVRSSGEDLQPDLAFNNDIPLDLTKQFTPFGKEPRMFDNFFLADKEVFSKKGAKVTIDVGVAPRGILGPPTAIEYDGMIRVFSVGTNGRLAETIIDPFSGREPEWPDHEPPPDTRLALGSTPSAVTYSMSEYNTPMLAAGEIALYDSPAALRQISVFARGENGHLLERYFNGVQWQWIDHGTPKDSITIIMDPSAIYYHTTYGNTVVSAYVTGSDGTIYKLYRNLDTMSVTWVDHSKPNGVTIASSPFAEKYYETTGASIGNRVKVFVRGNDGNLHELDCAAGDNSSDTWRTYELPGIKMDSKAFAQLYELGNSGDLNGNHALVFVKDTDGNLWELDTGTNYWGDTLGHPPGVKIESDADGFIQSPGGKDGYSNATDKNNRRSSEGKRIFVRGTDGCLWERTDTDPWIPHQSPANAKLKFSPFTLHENENGSAIFLASTQNSINGYITNYNVWNEYKDPNETALTPTLSWEYWNDKGWSSIVGIEDGTDNLLKAGQIMFVLPDNIEQTEIAGQKNYWIRTRIVGGDFGRESYVLDLAGSLKAAAAEARMIPTRNTIRPPVITSLKIAYILESRQYPQKCLTYNNLDYIDQTDACRIADKLFSPFVELDETSLTLYLGFEKPFDGGPVKIFLDARELSYSEETKPKLAWSCSGKNEWLDLDALDATEGFVRREILELIGPDDLAAHSRFGDYLYWLKGSLVEGAYEQLPVLAGIYPNTTWALQAATRKNEILGSGNGETRQAVAFLKVPVLPGEVVRVREILTEEERQKLLSIWGESAIFEVRDEKGTVTETWVLWNEVPDFFDSREEDRHYTLDRAIGQLRFGDGENGMMPPEGTDNIKAFSYQYGGGASGNVRSGEIKTLKSAVAGVDKVTNRVAADGGADTASLDDMLEIGPAMISHRNRAVTVEDFQWLARDASRKVVKVKCLSNTRPGTNDELLREDGWVTVIIVPDSPEPQPRPTLELKALVQRHLEARCALSLSAAQHLHVDGPGYTEIDVSVDLFVASMDSASQVEREARQRLAAFFHPLTGGPEEKGWDFGRDVSASDVYALLEDIEGLDHLENLRLSAEGSEGGDVVPIGDNFLVAAGLQTVKIQLAKGV